MSTLPLRKSWLLGLALLGLAGCSEKPVLEGANLEALAGLAEQVDQQRLMALVQELVDAHLQDPNKVDCSAFEGMQPQRPCELTNERAGALVQARLEELGLRVVRHDATEGPFTTSNIVAELPGTTRPWEVVLVGAHYDAYYGGADDNSTGVAAMLEMARILSRYQFDRTLRFVGFDLEEYGVLGSNRYVESQLGPDELVASVVFDCIGYYDTTPGSQMSLPGLPSPDAADFLAVIGNEHSSQQATELYALGDALKLLKLVPILSPRNGASPLASDLLRSDHIPFWLTGRKALFLTDTANFRNAHYHQPTDTPGTLNPPLFRQAVQLSTAALAYWAGGPR